MADESWRPIPGFGGQHEVSSTGRVRTTAQPSGSGASVVSLLLLAVVAVVLCKAQLVNSLATAVTLSLCAVPAVWVVQQLLAEAVFAARCRRYRKPVQTPSPPRALPRGPLAIEAARPKVVMVVEHEAGRMKR